MNARLGRTGRYKYAVLERDPAVYTAIRAMFSQGKPDAKTFYKCLERALAKEVTPGHAANAAQHVWGYVGKAASAAEAGRVLADIAALDEEVKGLPRLKRGLRALAENQGQGYLLRSLYFFI